MLRHTHRIHSRVRTWYKRGQNSLSLPPENLPLQIIVMEKYLGSTSSSPAMSTTTTNSGAAAVAAAAAGGGPGPATPTAVPASVCTSSICSSSSLPEIKLIDTNMSDEKLNQEEHLLTIAINSIGCKNYVMNNDIVHKYSYCDILGHRYNDLDLKYIAKEEDRSCEGSCIVSPPPLYRKGPLIASLVSQYGLGKPFDQNKLSQKIVKRCTQ